MTGTFSLFGGHYSPVVVVVMLLMVGVTGALVGANEAASGGEPVDMFELLHEETFTDDGDLKESEPAAQPAELRDVNERLDEHSERLESLFPETPGIDRWMRQNLVKRMVLAAFHVADAGFRVGYAMASTVGVGVTRFVLNGAVVSVLAGVALHTYRVFREVGKR
jgi:hypothetical protein